MNLNFSLGLVKRETEKMVLNYTPWMDCFLVWPGESFNKLFEHWQQSKIIERNIDWKRRTLDYGLKTHNKAV